MSISDVFDLMLEYPDIYIVTDTKSNDIDKITKQFNQMVQTAQNKNCTELLNRFLVYIYSPEMYQCVNNIYAFDNYIYAMYVTGYTDYSTIADFCDENNIPVVATWSSWYNDDSSIRELSQEKNLYVFTHTVDTLSTAVSDIHLGAFGVCTNYFSPSYLKEKI